jgi:hypothetical protein
VIFRKRIKKPASACSGMRGGDIVEFVFAVKNSAPIIPSRPRTKNHEKTTLCYCISDIGNYCPQRFSKIFQNALLSVAGMVLELKLFVFPVAVQVDATIYQL